MNGPQEEMLKELLRSIQEIEFWIKRIAQKLGADKGLEPEENTK